MSINGVWGNEEKAAVAEVAKQLNAEYCRIDFRELDNKTARLALFTEHYNRHKDFRESENMKLAIVRLSQASSFIHLGAEVTFVFTSHVPNYSSQI
ncbi:hypothetical protein Pelo_18849 [Pelomyxa schiedti]|nr:hypothetical protein Pelo_18849 [Pelomyxa schiedti]